jgi:hypothetical protein
MKTRRMLFSLTTLLIFVSLSHAGGEPSPRDLKLMAMEDFSARVESAKNIIFSTLSPDERAIAEKVDLRITPSEDIGRVFAALDNGRPYIELSLGWGRLMVVIVQAMGNLSASKTIQYINYIVDEQRRNLERSQKGEPLQPVFFFPEWDHWSTEQIETMKTNNSAADSAIFEGVILFALAHEYAHHVLRHVKPGPQPILAATRQQETDAADGPRRY